MTDKLICPFCDGLLTEGVLDKNRLKCTNKECCQYDVELPVTVLTSVAKGVKAFRNIVALQAGIRVTKTKTKNMIYVDSPSTMRELCFNNIADMTEWAHSNLRDSSGVNFGFGSDNDLNILDGVYIKQPGLDTHASFTKTKLSQSQNQRNNNDYIL